MNETLHRIVLYSSNLGIRFFNRFRQRSLNYFENKKWDDIFKNGAEYIYTNAKGIKLKLHRQSKLTELILFYDFEKEELDFVDKFLQRGDYFLDIGANIGIFSLHASLLVGETGKVFSFEPTPSTFERLSNNIALNNAANIVASNVGLSDKPQTMLINESSSGYDAWNTFADVKQMDEEIAKTFVKKTEVNVIKLDSFLVDRKVEVEKIALVKIDVEGWEKFVLAGARDFLSNYAPVVMMEFTEKNTWAAGYMCQELYDIMVGFGYEWYTYDQNSQELLPDPRRFQYPYNNLIAVKPNSPYRLRMKFKI